MASTTQSVRLDEDSKRQLEIIKSITGLNASEAIRAAIRTKARDISLAFVDHENYIGLTNDLLS